VSGRRDFSEEYLVTGMGGLIDATKSGLGGWISLSFD
jgi:hypothetical protein